MNKNMTIGSVSKNIEPFYISDYFEKVKTKSILYIARDEKEIFDISNKLQWLIPNVDILLYRSWDQIPYDRVSPSKEIQSERIKTLYQINNNKKSKIVITSVNAIIQKTINKDFLNSNLIHIKKNSKINFKELINKLILLGYERTNVVREKSEFAIRGSIIDVYLIDKNNPLRLDFFDDILETISEFDRISQKTIKKLQNDFLINPSSELIINDYSINLFRKTFRNIFIDYRHSIIYKSFSDFIIPPGGENFLPLFNTSLSSLFSYCSDFDIIINSDFDELLQTRLENINDFYNVRNNTGDIFHLPPNHLYLNDQLIKKEINNFTHIKFHDYKLEKNNFIIKKIPNLSSIRKEIDFKFIKKFLSINSNKKIIICTRSYGSINRIKSILLEQLNISLYIIENFDEIDNQNIIYITILNIQESLEYKNYVFINEKTLFGFNFSINQKKEFKREFFFEEINKLTKNSILVHSEYGFCRFIDIRKLKIHNSLHDCIELEFADNQLLFIPIENLNLITKYSNDENKNIKLDRLGAAHWQKRKAKAKNKIKEVAKKLISIAAIRLNSHSYKIEYDSILYEKFSSTFPYVETEDQLRAINDIKSDFAKNIPSDRLIVGDVAFGKTEIIMRAVFLAAKSNIQSLILVPTTLLSRQHFDNFLKRLTPFNIVVTELSKFIKSKDRLQTIRLLSEGKIDLIIGTHALLNDKIIFKKLGLIIYDEEQKLGTQQKEKLKKLAPRAHVISLSATPIPRTLSLSLSGIRDLSLILTAPYERLSVRTYTAPFDEMTIIEAIKREIYGRKNSVFFVTPRKKDIPFIENFLKEKLPDVKYITAHGQLNSKILEDRITKFYNKEVPLMISTNIIENGLDLPYVNTIIIYRSNIFSLSSLYQLKGRVGRSTRRGYAYLTYNEKDITDNARKRLNIINSYDEIGSGFNIASQDLELRGSGSIIGEEQSGFIKEVGTELYHQMLEEEILLQKKDLIKKEEKIKTLKFQPIINIPEEIFISDEYINDLDIKMSIYKRISLIKNNQERNNMMIELIDRFGILPKEVENLFKLIEIKILCIKFNLEQIEFGTKGILFSFYNNKPFNPEKIIKLGISHNNQITIRSDQKLFYDLNGELNDDRFDLIKKLIKIIN